MKQMRRVGNYLLTEPFTWIFQALFQPGKFKEQMEYGIFTARLISLTRLLFPMFLVSYVLALILRLIFFPYLFTPPPTLSSILFTTAWPTLIGLASGCVIGAAGGTAGSIALGIAGGVMGDFPFGITIGITNFILLNPTGAITINTGAIFPLGLTEVGVEGLCVGIILGVRMGAVGVLGAVVLGIVLGVIRFVTGGFWVGALFFATFLVSYLVGFYRLPLYFVSAPALLQTYWKSRKDSPGVFDYLHHSPLYWDECAVLPLPGLKNILLIAVGENVKRAQKEIDFIFAERPYQIRATRTSLMEIAIRDLETRDSMRDIANAYKRLDEILAGAVGLIDTQWLTQLNRLKDTSKEAARYRNVTKRRSRLEALATMREYLTDVFPSTALGDTVLTRRLGDVVARWLTAIEREQDKQEQAPHDIGQIDNPYTPGTYLLSDDSRFVGRGDLLWQFEEAFSERRGSLFFLLFGERRMGKSSTLWQLPNLLGAHYDLIIFDLQTSGIAASAAAFLGAIAEEIYTVMDARGTRLKKLEQQSLEEAGQDNEATVYLLFNKWFKNVERLLEREDRSVLLVFDEFEILEEAEQDGHLKLRLLLNWFRSAIQNYRRLALLFSGLQTFSDTNADWAGYFVNVRTLKVSFLEPAEARKLIIRPVAAFPGEQIYGVAVVEEIERVTACHPFLVQAVCAELIRKLNKEAREQIEIGDLDAAVDLVLKDWNDYFLDLWNRSSTDERVCLRALLELGYCDIRAVEQRTRLDRQASLGALQSLQQRDLIRL